MVRAFAEACIFGLPVERMLHSHDETERDFWEAVRVEAGEVWDLLMTNLARKVIKETADARKRGSGG